MTKGTNTSEVVFLEKQWRMLLANKLHWQDSLTQSEAMTKAGLTCRVLDALGRGIAMFSYIKKEDGSLREARGTLKRGIDTDFDNYKPKKKKKKKHRDNSNTDGTYRYWDLDGHGFRSFESANLLSLDGFIRPAEVG